MISEFKTEFTMKNKLNNLPKVSLLTHQCPVSPSNLHCIFILMVSAYISSLTFISSSFYSMQILQALNNCDILQHLIWFDLVCKCAYWGHQAVMGKMLLSDIKLKILHVCDKYLNLHLLFQNQSNPLEMQRQGQLQSESLGPRTDEQRYLSPH